MLKKITQKELNEMLKEAIKKVADADIDVNYNIIPEIRIANARSYFGQCRQRPEGYEISISKYHLTNERDAVFQTMVHEVLHTIDGCMNHGKKWQSLAGKVNEKYGFNISRVGTAASGVTLNTPPRVIKYKFSILCKNCGSEYKRQRVTEVTKNPENYRCGKCKGNLEIIEL